mgnify:FL=1
MGEAPQSTISSSAFRDLQKTAGNNECSVCGGMLTVAFLDGQLRIRCGNDKAHQGHRKIKSYSQMYDEGEAIPISIANNIERKRRREMKERATTLGLVKFQGVTKLSQAEAHIVVKSIWPDAPDLEVLKAAVLCRDFKINPLNPRTPIFLICYNKGKETETWSLQLGIGTKRWLASHQGTRPPSYVDGPRIMTDAEQKAIRGEVDDAKWWAITVVERDGNRYPGYGSFGKKDAVKGADKGNNPQNMAFTRSESAALHRMDPGGVPDVEVVDETYIREITPEAPQLEQPAARPASPAPGESGTQEESAPGPVVYKRDPTSIKTLAELWKAAYEDFNLQPAPAIQKLGYTRQVDVAETPAECYVRLAAMV